MIFLRLILAAISVIIGIAGLLLPILPGWLFLGLAALLLFPETALARKALTKIEGRFPSIARLLRSLTER